MEYTREQLKAAYALNLCTVSVSQIIEYNDVQIMEQEYEAILNNLNLEQMPKDEALLKILKQLLDTITFFRIQEGDKQLLEREYQQKMKNAIWSAVPNIGMIVAGGNPVTMAVSLASQVGISYMNYRRAKADNELEKDRQRWQLERTAIEQFNGLQRELFDTAWRLAAAYEFPDKLRLTERQIKQYNAILMDGDLMRKYERLDAIKENFMAYPPFWYHFGNTANAIAGSDELKLPDTVKSKYQERARSHYQQYRQTNDHGLLREDQLSAACALELLDLLPLDSDKDSIYQLLDEAVRYSGRANDVLQLAAVAYLKLNDQQNASVLLRQLVNEQYNTVLNAQLLSSLYVSNVIKNGSEESKDAYAVLQMRVGDRYLYPMPAGLSEDKDQLEERFIRTQRKVLFDKYQLVLRKYEESYSVKYGRILPVADPGNKYDSSYYSETEESIQRRKDDYQEIFAKGKRAEQYRYELREIGWSFRILDVLNRMYGGILYLDLVNESVQQELAQNIENAIKRNRDRLNKIQDNIDSGHFNYSDMCSLIDLHFNDFKKEFFETLIKHVNRYVQSREEMQDFAIAEQNLTEFCERENLPSPEVLYGKDGDEAGDVEDDVPNRFGINLLDSNSEESPENISAADKMKDLINQAIPAIVLNPAFIDFFTCESSKLERYFNNNPRLKKDHRLKAMTIAVLDDKDPKGGYDLIFTSKAVTPIKNGSVKSPIAYKDIDSGKGYSLNIGGNFCSGYLNMKEITSLIRNLAEIALPMPEKSAFQIKIPFGKK